MNLNRFLQGVDLDRIRDVTREAEQATGGELVCVVVGRCDDYPAASWRGAALGALTAVTIDAVVGVFSTSWSPAPAGWSMAIVLFGLVVGWTLVTWLPGLARQFIDRDLIRHRVARRAAQAFIQEEVFATVDRSGILLLIAVFERRVEIMADRGIGAQVPESAWEEVVENLERGLPGPDRGAAIERAVEDLGKILVEYEIARREDDINELSDEPRILDR